MWLFSTIYDPVPKWLSPVGNRFSPLVLHENRQKLYCIVPNLLNEKENIIHVCSTPETRTINRTLLSWPVGRKASLKNSLPLVMFRVEVVVSWTLEQVLWAFGTYKKRACTYKVSLYRKNLPSFIRKCFHNHN